MVAVRAIGNSTYSGSQVGYDLWENEETLMPEPVAIHASVANASRTARELRQGKPLVKITGTLTPRGQAYLANVERFVATHPAWDTQLEGFPRYFDTFAT
jgi:hypothetical protein